MRKERFLLFVAILLISFTLICSIRNNCLKKNDSITERVDEIIEIKMADATYKNSSLEEKKSIISHLLSQLQGNKYILSFSYDEDNNQFSFIYSDNSLGGIKLTELNSKVGNIPIN